MQGWPAAEAASRREQLTKPLLRALILAEKVFAGNAFRRAAPLLKREKHVAPARRKKVWIDSTKVKDGIWDIVLWL